MRYLEQANSEKVEHQLPSTGGGSRNEELLFNDYRVSIWDDEQILEMNTGDGCTL